MSALRQRLTLSQRIGLALNPAMHLSLSILRMSAADLDEAITAEAAQNPFLVIERARAPPAQAGASLEAVSVAAAPSLRERLLRQIATLPLTDPERRAAALLVAELDPDGFLPVTLEELAGECAQPLVDLERALAVVQSLEPVGVGARSVAECLTLQLVERGLSPPDAAATIAHLPQIAAQDWAQAAREMGLERAALKARAALLDGLRLRPHDPDEGEAHALEPDLRIDTGAHGVHSVHLTRDFGRQVALDRGLMAAGGFAPELAQRAEALIEALAMRGRTLVRIGEWLVARQQGFLLHGMSAMIPATRVQAAADLGLHPSTVGRAIAGKAVDVGGRVWPLSVFFSVGPGAGAMLSARAIGQRISELVAAEAPGAPLSDTAICTQLNREGVDIARRTVAKYRQGLRIPPASVRRRLARARRAAARG